MSTIWLACSTPTGCYCCKTCSHSRRCHTFLILITTDIRVVVIPSCMRAWDSLYGENCVYGRHEYNNVFLLIMTNHVKLGKYLNLSIHLFHRIEKIHYRNKWYVSLLQSWNKVILMKYHVKPFVHGVGYEKSLQSLVHKICEMRTLSCLWSER